MVGFNSPLWNEEDEVVGLEGGDFRENSVRDVVVVEPDFSVLEARVRAEFPAEEEYLGVLEVVEVKVETQELEAAEGDEVVQQGPEIRDPVLREVQLEVSEAANPAE